MQDDHLGDALKHFSSAGVDIAFIDVVPRGPDLIEPILLIHGFASNHRINWVNPRWVENSGRGGTPCRRLRQSRPRTKRKALCALRLSRRTDDERRGQSSCHFEIERADVMGYSMGARIASFLALPSRISCARSFWAASATGSCTTRGCRRHRRSDGGAVARQPRRSDPAPVPRLRRSNEERSRSARRLRPRLAPEPDAGGGGRITPPTLVAVGDRDTIAGDPSKLVALLAAGGGALHSWTRSQSRRRRQDVQGRGACLSCPPGVTGTAAVPHLDRVQNRYPLSCVSCRRPESIEFNQPLERENHVTIRLETSTLRLKAGLTGRTIWGTESPWSWPRRKPEARRAMLTSRFRPAGGRRGDHAVRRRDRARRRRASRSPRGDLRVDRPNGAGKTTLFNCISRLYDPDAGSIVFDGRPLASFARHELASLGIARTFQNVALFATMTVRDNVRVGAHALARGGFLANALAMPRAKREERRSPSAATR